MKVTFTYHNLFDRFDYLSNRFSKFWALNPEIDFLNHGSFGATPTCVLQAQQEWILRLERDPIEFLAPERSLLPKLNHVRETIGQLINAPAADIVFVRNATDGVNAVIRSFPLREADEVVITNHGYNACNNAVRFAAERAGAVVKVAEVPFPIRSKSEVIDAVEAKLSRRTRLLLIDHVTSPTGIILPVAELAQLAHHRGIRVMVDGAHAPGMIPVDLQELDADYYTANHHKWLCGPKASGILYVRREYQAEVHPTIISHGANTDQYGETRFLAEFNWIGTFDPSPILVMPSAIEFLSGLHSEGSADGGIERLMAANRSLALAGRKLLLEQLDGDEPAPEEMIGSLASVPLPALDGLEPQQLVSFKQQLYQQFRIEVPNYQLSGQRGCVRISAQAYNHIGQYERVASALREMRRIAF